MISNIMRVLACQNSGSKIACFASGIAAICGFANAQGGTLYIGIDDNGSAIGISDSKKLLEDIPNKIRDTMGIIAEVNLIQKSGKAVIEIKVEPSQFPVNYKG